MKLPKTKTQLKKIIRTVMEAEYGFAPPISKITLLEAVLDDTCIMFSINGKDYQLNYSINWTPGTALPAMIVRKKGN